MPSPRVSKYHRQATALSPRVSKYHRQAIALHLTTGVIKEASSRIVYITDIFLTMTVTESKVQKQPPGKLTNMADQIYNQHHNHQTKLKQTSNPNPSKIIKNKNKQKQHTHRSITDAIKNTRTIM